MTRQELYDLIWSQPAKTIAPQFEISDVALSKICEKHEVPQPPRGYWAKIAAGKPAPKFPLPARGLGIPDAIDLTRDRWGYRRVPDNLVELDLGPRPSFDEPASAVIERVRKLVGKVTVPRDLARAHHAIQKFLDNDAKRREAYLADRHRSFFNAPLFDSPFEQRRLRLVNAIALALAKLGCKPGFGRRKEIDGVHWKVGLQKLGMVIDEPDYQRYGWRSRDDLVKPATTTLRVKINFTSEDVQTVWIDKGGSRVEESITDIAVAAVACGEFAYRRDATSYYDRFVEIKARRIEDEKKERAERERKERERLAAERQARIDGLLKDAGEHRKANDIRTYVAAVRAGAENISADQLERWASWALALADDLDPLYGFGLKEWLKVYGDE